MQWIYLFAFYEKVEGGKHWDMIQIRQRQSQEDWPEYITDIKVYRNTG